MTNVQTQGKGFQASLKSIGGAGRHVAAATMTVTVALEEVRRRGHMHRDDCRNMTSAERNSYVDLAKRELGIESWEPSREQS